MIKLMAVCAALAMAAPSLALAGPERLVLAATAPEAAPDTSDYMMKAGQSDQFEIESGRLAATKAASPKLRKFAHAMVVDHTKSTKLVMRAAAKSGMPAPASPPALDADQQQMLTALQGVSGSGFDQTYLTQQTQAHQKALALQEAYAEGGSNPHFKSAAKKIVPVVKKHMAMLSHMTTGSTGM